VSALQAEMFGSTTLSTSPVGLVIEHDRACPHCGTAAVVIGSSAKMHAARLTCCSCVRHCGWLSGQTHQFVSEIINHFGRPTEPITVRHNEFVPAHEYSAAATATATPTERKKPMHIDQLYPSKFMRCADLNGRPMHVTIAGIKREDVGGEQKVVLSFANGEKSLISIKPTQEPSPRRWATKLAPGLAKISSWFRHKSIFGAISLTPSACAARGSSKSHKRRRLMRNRRSTMT
jgi:hypothetical protein